jgi:hypothetical protein
MSSRANTEVEDISPKRTTNLSTVKAQNRKPCLKGVRSRLIASNSRARKGGVVC